MRPHAQITILGLNYAPEPTGNAPYTTALAEHLAALGASVHVVTTFPHYPQWERQAGLEGRRLVASENGVDVLRVAHYVPRPPRGLRRLRSELSFGVRAATAPWHRPDVVVLVSPALFASAKAMVRAVLGRHRRVVWVQDLYYQGMAETGEGSGFAARIAKATERWTLRRSHVVVAIHEAMAERIADDLGVPADKIRTIPNWTHIVPSVLSRTQARRALGWEQEGFIALHAGNMGLKQGLENVVAAARLADALAEPPRFVLLGDGAERERLGVLGAGVSSLAFVDPLPEEHFPLALAAADVLLVNELPGVREMAVPSKLTSYLATGRPIVAAGEPNGVVARVLSDSGAGTSVSSGDPAALLEAVLAHRANPVASALEAEAGTAHWREHLSADAAFRAWVAALDAALVTRH